MKTSALIAPAALLVALCLGACANTKTEATATTPNASLGMVNTTCPFSGKPLSESSPTVEYEGQKVGMCCTGCATRFGKLDASAQAALVSKAK